MTAPTQAATMMMMATDVAATTQRVLKAAEDHGQI